jgi:hypothetical protein
MSGTTSSAMTDVRGADQRQRRIALCQCRLLQKGGQLPGEGGMLLVVRIGVRGELGAGHALVHLAAAPLNRLARWTKLHSSRMAPLSASRPKQRARAELAISTQSSAGLGGMALVLTMVFSS